MEYRRIFQTHYRTCHQLSSNQFFTDAKLNDIGHLIVDTYTDIRYELDIEKMQITGMQDMKTVPDSFVYVEK